MSNSSSNCENCGHENLESFIDRPGHQLKRCPKCNLFQKGILESASVYEGDYHSCYSVRRDSKIRTAKLRLASTTPYVNSANPRMIDIGCSVGATVEAAKMMGWNAHGVDISQSAVKYCQSRGLDCHKIDGVKLPFKDNHFDVLTNWHVIEHCEDVKETLEEWYRVIKPGGVMILETPDSTYLKARWMGTRYAKFWPAEHLYTFDPKNLASILKQSGFEILPTRLLGRRNALSKRLALFSLAYRGTLKAFRSLRLSKSLEICCRKPAEDVVLQKAA